MEPPYCQGSGERLSLVLISPDSDNLYGLPAHLPEGPRGKFGAGARSSAG